MQTKTTTKDISLVQLGMTLANSTLTGEKLWSDSEIDSILSAVKHHQDLLTIARAYVDIAEVKGLPCPNIINVIKECEK